MESTLGLHETTLEPTNVGSLLLERNHHQHLEDLQKSNEIVMEAIQLLGAGVRSFFNQRNLAKRFITEMDFDYDKKK